MLELLSPAGSPEAVKAAVQSGADAIYLGYGTFNARRNAKNFSKEELAAAVSYCHLREVKVYLTMNTLISDRELPDAAALAAEASGLGLDAILVQDLGVARLLRTVAPDLPVHASTQMTVHSLDGVRRCAEMGMTRVVLSRELARDDIAHICAHSPIEIEVFVHGALCMCYSGQCYLSSVIGGRSGNRGLCAQPCRLPYGWGDRADGYPLSLKDLSLVGHLGELAQMGVACVKLEGRMKRPEYVAIATEIYARALREGREPTAQDRRQLAAAFSRQGFTEGYYTGRKGPAMFGVREEERQDETLFAAARARVEAGETRAVPVTFYAMVRPGEPLRVGVEDERGRVATAEGPVPEKARTREVTAEMVDEQLGKTGGTVYACKAVRALVEPGLSLPLSAFNSLRRQVLDDLSAQRVAIPARRTGQFSAGARYENRRDAPILTMSLLRAEQLTPELLALRPALVYLPVEELVAGGPRVREAIDRGAPLAVSLPRICTDRELPQLKEQMWQVRELGISEALLGNFGLLELTRELGFLLRGDFGLNVYNTQAVKELKRMGFSSATASFELRLAQIRDISKAIDIEMIVYGRLPLMIVENCIIENRAGRCACENVNVLTDRRGERFPVVKTYGCRNELLNGKKLFLADKQEQYQSIGLWAARLAFTTENPRECVQVTERYLGRGPYEPGEFTRGLYYREVE